MEKFDFSKRVGSKRVHEFCAYIRKISKAIGFRISSRGWCYQLETERIINKDEFPKVEKLINRCRKRGLLPVDFVAEEVSRDFEGIIVPHDVSPADWIASWLDEAMMAENSFQPEWWDGEEYYIQMLVEKIDLKTLFRPVCDIYKIPIATSKGWSSISQRALYAERFKQAEEQGLKCVLLYCGDHDPDGLRISDFIYSNLDDIKHIYWNEGGEGYDPQNLTIDRFGLNADFIKKHNLTWIDNLITGNQHKKMDLGSPKHPNHKLPYVQQYLRRYGARKCEANAVVPKPKEARKLAADAIESYLGEDAPKRFRMKKAKSDAIFRKIRKDSGVKKFIDKAIKSLDKY